MPDPDLAEQFKAIADPTRLAILRLLPHNSCSCEVYNVSELAEEIGVAQPSVSHHLRILRQAGLVRSRKMQRDVYYWIDHDKAGNLVAHLSGLFADVEPPPDAD